jgi:hypothetical protein
MNLTTSNTIDPNAGASLLAMLALRSVRTSK